MSYIDSFLNSITMYRLILYGLLILSAIGILFGYVGLLPLNGTAMIASMIILLSSTAISNMVFGKIFSVPVNVESCFITAYILFLIMPPPESVSAGLILALTGTAAMASKYVLNFRGKHLFNPVAIAALLVSLTGLAYPTWWIGSAVMLPAVFIIGFLIIKKIRRRGMALAFSIVALLGIIVSGIMNDETLVRSAVMAFTSWPLVFFAAFMLTEPITSPPTQSLRIVYGALIGTLFGTTYSFGPLQSSPELALVLGNIYSFIVSPKERLILMLKEKIQLAPLLYDFVFSADKKFGFAAGQYLEWTIGANRTDGRGNRRYFTIASAPTEDTVRLGVKIPDKPSTFKQSLLALQPGDAIVAGSLSGDFQLPQDNSKKVVAIAGGIGITPFRSMIKEIIDTRRKTDLVLFYTSVDPKEFVYSDVLENAGELGVKTVKVLTAKQPVPEWTGKTGFITEQMIEQEASDHKNRIYFLSGPNAMVMAYKKLLLSMGISRNAIHTDYFPGY